MWSPVFTNARERSDDRRKPGRQCDRGMAAFELGDRLLERERGRRAVDAIAHRLVVVGVAVSYDATSGNSTVEPRNTGVLTSPA